MTPSGSSAHLLCCSPHGKPRARLFRAKYLVPLNLLGSVSAAVVYALDRQPRALAPASQVNKKKKKKKKSRPPPWLQHDLPLQHRVIGLNLFLHVLLHYSSGADGQAADGRRQRRGSNVYVCALFESECLTRPPACPPARLPARCSPGLSACLPACLLPV
ncbi:hypothetical protein IWX90DRAFT_1821 [Phyllosticta citrichinensis]|uniref:Uncharacterized protein n=1 Tax=Phyllosticta citrichinensis TaxID=1130410 RepID=A0ABR1Y4W6_9PEZI